MPGWPGWLACLAWLGWLGWIDWNDCLKSSTLDALKRSAELDFWITGYLDSCQNNGLMHPQSGLLCGAALSLFLFPPENMTFWKHICFNDFQMIFKQTGLICY